MLGGNLGLSEITFKSGKTLFSEGDGANTIYIVESGIVEIFKEREGQIIVLNKVGKGDIIGTLSLLGEKKRSASARTIGKVKCKVLNVEELFSSNEVPKWTITIIKDLIHRFNDLERKLLAMKLKRK